MIYRIYLFKMSFSMALLVYQRVALWESRGWVWHGLAPCFPECWGHAKQNLRRSMRLRLPHHHPQNDPGNHLGQPKDQRYPWQLLDPGISWFINVCEATYRLHSAYWIIHHPRSGESETMTRMGLFLLSLESLECVRKTVCLSIVQFLLWFVITPPQTIDRHRFWSPKFTNPPGTQAARFMFKKNFSRKGHGPSAPSALGRAVW